MTTTRDELKLYDVRTLERNFRKGLITRKDYDKYLKALPDRASNISDTPPPADEDDRYDDADDEDEAVASAAGDEDEADEA